MTSHRKTLIEMVTTQAERSFPSDLLHQAGGFDLWEEHWLKTAEKIHSDLSNEGLVETAKAVQQHIDFTKSLRTPK